MSNDQVAIESFEDAMDVATTKVMQWAHDLAEMLPNMVLALVIFVLTVLFSYLISSIGKKTVTRVSDNQMLAGLVSAMLKVFVIMIGLYLALSILQLNKTVTSLLAGAGILGLALGFAFQDAASNLLAGVVMGVRRPFNVGDLIESNGYLGYVKKLNLRNTLVENFTGQLVLIPNKLVFENPLENYSYYGHRRISLEVGVGYDTDLKEAERVLRESIEGLSFLAKDEEVRATCMEFGDSSINWRIDYWIDFPDGPSYLESIHGGMLAIRNALSDAGIEIPFPIRTLDVRSSDVLHVDKEK